MKRKFNLISALLIIGVRICDGQTAYVANYIDNTVSVIDVTTNIVTNTIPVGHVPYSFGNFISI